MAKGLVMTRILSSAERKEIRKLVLHKCANHDFEYGCLPLDCKCIMLNKFYTSGFCKYFKICLLSQSAELQATLTGKNTKKCKMCENTFIPKGRQTYCFEKCTEIGNRQATAQRVKKHRQNKGNM